MSTPLGEHLQLLCRLCLLIYFTLLYFYRNFAATQTKGVSCAIYKKYMSKARAEEAYEEAVRDGFVQVL